MSPRTPGEPGNRPLPPRLDPRAGRPGPGRPHREPPAAGLRRRRAVVVSRAVAALLSVAILAGSGWGWYLGQVADATVNRTDAIPGSGNEDGDGVPEAMNLLLVGNDSRADLTDEQLAELSAGTDSGVNTDTMILVHVPADGSRASFVSFPRDSYVEIPGHGPDKLNAAYSYGYHGAGESASENERQAAGAQLLVKTISRMSGLQIDHYAEVDLLGFFNLTSVVGGVEVNLCNAVDDSRWSGAVFPAGEQTISGADALKFVRQRHGLPRVDIDRIVRQQVFIAGVLRKMLSDEVLLDLGKQRELVQAAAESLTVDEDLDLLQLAEQMQSVTAASIEFRTIPIVDPDGRDAQGRSIVELEDEETLHRFFAELSAEPDEPEAPAPVETVRPEDVQVEVLNGSGTSGLGASAAEELSAAGFGIADTGNADSSDYTQTVVRHAAGDESLAATVAAQIPGAVPELDDSAASGTVTLVLGSDFNGVGEATAPEPAPDRADDVRTAEDRTCIN
ncbi:LCP family protein [Blastococcus sp. TBT05-19]|uniref:LCP family protein n=1 Tax=Blastococcus sp. TBT05-19 TaxID=2250581 RepID=UPI001F1E105E|nr:LCP family protein [Blastococcus sp. TBT05-19]